jgi:hypothetical protein
VLDVADLLHHCAGFAFVGGTRHAFKLDAASHFQTHVAGFGHAIRQPLADHAETQIAPADRFCA